MLKQYEELSVLEQGDDGAIITVRGQGGPSVLLTDGYLLHLERVLAEAEAELSVVQHNAALRLLCSEVGTLLATYNETRNKYYGAPAPKKTLTVALMELDELRRQLDEF
jgi:hypothetical protein